MRAPSRWSVRETASQKCCHPPLQRTHAKGTLAAGPRPQGCSMLATVAGALSGSARPWEHTHACASELPHQQSRSVAHCAPQPALRPHRRLARAAMAGVTGAWLATFLLLAMAVLAAPADLSALDRAFGEGSSARAELMAAAHRARHEPIEHRQYSDSGSVLLQLRRRQRSHEEVLELANSLKVRSATSPEHAARLAAHAGESKGARRAPSFTAALVLARSELGADLVAAAAAAMPSRVAPSALVPPGLSLSCPPQISAPMYRTWRPRPPR